MKSKILVVLLVIVVIILAILLGIKFASNENIEGNLVENELAVQEIEQTPEPEVPKSKYSGNERTIAVVIDNVDAAIPQTGLNKAMVVYEVYVEGGITRLLAVFKGEDIDTIGPVRSARPIFIDYALENDSIFVHYGGSPRALDDVTKLKMDNANGIYSPLNVFWRTNKKKAPHNALTNTERILEWADNQKYRQVSNERTVLNYVVDPVNLEDGMDATSVNIPYKASKVKYTYNEEIGLYERYRSGKLCKDWLTDEVLTTKNIIITVANNYSTDEENGYGRQEFENIGIKDGYYITNGKAIKITCEKKTRDGKTVYKDLEGNEIEVNDGNTYIQLVPPSMTVTIE